MKIIAIVLLSALPTLGAPSSLDGGGSTDKQECITCWN